MPARDFTVDEVDEFYLAAGRGDLDGLQRCLNAGLDVDSATLREFHRTPLMAAAMTDQAEAARLLLDHGAALDVRDRELGCTPVLLAAQQRSARVLGLLTEAGARLNLFNSAGYSALFWCIENGDTKSMELLLAAGADPGRQNRDGLAPLHLCSAFCRVDLARQLLEAGAAPDPVSCELHGRHTPLTLAAGLGGAERLPLLDLLVKHGADLEHGAEEGTALALARGRPEFAARLEALQRGHRLAERRRSSCSGVSVPQQKAAAAASAATRARRQQARQTAAAAGRRPQSALPSSIYPASSRPRGLCLVAGSSRFAHPLDYPNLPAVEERLELLAAAFSDLGLLIRPAMGLGSGDLLTRVQRLADCDHSSADLLVCAFLGYALGGGVVGSDCRPADIGQLVDCFSPTACPSLAGKPKLFLFLLTAAPRARIGRGGGGGKGVLGGPPSCPDPSQPHCLLAYACVFGQPDECSRLDELLRRLRRSLDTEAEHADFGHLFQTAGERASADNAANATGAEPNFLVEVRHSLDKQLIFR